MYDILIVVYLLIAIALIGLILIQQGKGADMGASFGSGASTTLFGSSGSGNFLTKSTAILATLFFLISIFLGSLTSNAPKEEDGMGEAPVAAAVEAPAQESSDIPAADKAPATDVPN